MDLFKISKEMITGVEIIDKEHQEIAEKINLLFSHPKGTLSKAFIKAAIKDIHDMLEKHFQTEEQIFLKLGILENSVASLEHDSILKSLDNFIGDVEKNYSVSDEFKAFVVGTLITHMAMEAKDIKNASI